MVYQLLAIAKSLFINARIHALTISANINMKYLICGSKDFKE